MFVFQVSYRFSLQKLYFHLDKTESKQLDLNMSQILQCWKIFQEYNGGNERFYNNDKEVITTSMPFVS